MKFRTRLAWYGVAIATTTLLIFGLILSALIRRTGPAEQDQNLLDLARRTVAALANAPSDTFNGPALPPVPVDLTLSTEPYVAVVGGEGNVLFATGQVAGAPPEVPSGVIEEALTSGTSLTTFSPAPGVELRIVAVPFARPDLGLAGVVAAGQSTALVATNLAGLRAVLLVAGIVTALSSWLVARLVAGRALEPLKRLSITTAEIATTGELDRRLPDLASDDEVGNLSLSFNRMLDRLGEQQRELADSLSNQRRFVADASHELRNPLATIRANLSFLASHPEAGAADRLAALEDSGKAATRMTNLIDDLLRLARLDAGATEPLTKVLVGKSAEAAIAQVSEPVEFRPSHDEAVLATADGLERIMVNLLDNAFRHGRPPVELAITQVGEEIVVTVADHGDGIPMEQTEAIFDRFRRLEPSRTSTGTGLGLAIARALAHRFNGTLTAANQPAGGAVFTFTLPAHPS